MAGAFIRRLNRLQVTTDVANIDLTSGQVLALVLWEGTISGSCADIVPFVVGDSTVMIMWEQLTVSQHSEQIDVPAIQRKFNTKVYIQIVGGSDFKNFPYVTKLSLNKKYIAVS